MAEVKKTVAETTYDITGLTTYQAAVLEALLGQMSVDGRMQPVYEGLREQLGSDPTWKQRETVRRESVGYYAPTHKMYGYFTREKCEQA